MTTRAFDALTKRQQNLIVNAVKRIDSLIIERGGRELGEIFLHDLEDFLLKLIKSFNRSRPAEVYEVYKERTGPRRPGNRPAGPLDVGGPRPRR